MRTFHVHPQGALANYVERFWGLESEPGETVHMLPLLPGTGAELVFHYRMPFQLRLTGKSIRTPRMHLICGRRRALPLAPAQDLGFVAVRLRAGSLSQLMETGISGLVDQFAPAVCLGSTADAMELRLDRCRSNVERVCVLHDTFNELFLRSRGPAEVCRAVQLVYSRCASITLPSLASSIGVNQRTLERIVKRATGQTLVQIRTTSRFQKAIRHLLLQPLAVVGDGAIAYGFYDQSHFTRVMHSLGLPSPAAFVREARELTNFYNPPMVEPC